MTRADLLLLDEPTSGVDPLMEREFRHCVAEARSAGQTVFLSSHILTEVEALCDRVAILRLGGLVEVGTLAEIRHPSALSIEATFSDTPPDLSRLPGVSDVEVDGNRVRLQVRGSVQPLLERLAVDRQRLHQQLPQPADRQRLVDETRANLGMQAMFGPIHRIDTLALYAVWHNWWGTWRTLGEKVGAELLADLEDGEHQQRQEPRPPAPARCPSHGQVEPLPPGESDHTAYQRDARTVDGQEAERVVGPRIRQLALCSVPGRSGPAAQRIHDPEAMQRRMQVDPGQPENRHRDRDGCPHGSQIGDASMPVPGTPRNQRQRRAIRRRGWRGHNRQ